MEAICSSETSVDTQQTTWRYIPEDGTLQISRLFVGTSLGPWRLYDSFQVCETVQDLSFFSVLIFPYHNRLFCCHFVYSTYTILFHYSSLQIFRIVRIAEIQILIKQTRHLASKSNSPSYRFQSLSIFTSISDIPVENSTGKFNSSDLYFTPPVPIK
jgi:hypothetical protein